MSNLSELLPAGGGGKNVNFVASGTLSSGQTVVLNSDGTVSAVGTSISEALGTPTVLSGTPTVIVSTFDTNENKLVVAYKDAGNSDFGTAVVGTVSGSTISFGTPVVFEGNGAVDQTAITFDSSNNKVVIAYLDASNSSYGTAIVGTVSGTSISFGTKVVFEAASIIYTSAVFDSANSKVVIFYTDQGNSDYGTSIVGTVSGTSISFGTPVVFLSGYAIDNGSAYNSAAEKILIVYRNFPDQSRGDSRVGTVSGTSISFGTAVRYSGEYETSGALCAYDSTNQKMVVAYSSNETGTQRGWAVVGTISGTTISYGTRVNYKANRVNRQGIGYDPTSGKIVLAYRNIDASDKGYVQYGTVSGTSISFGSSLLLNNEASTAHSLVYANSAAKMVVSSYLATSVEGQSVTYQPPYSISNTDFIGITDSAISDTASGSVTIKGGISTNVTGLTANATYYVQDDGSLASGPIPFDISGATFTQNFSVQAQETGPYGLAFNTDGTKMFVVGVTGDDVNEYNLSVGFDVSTSVYSQNFSVSAQDNTPEDIAFNTNGTKMFIVGSNGQDINEYALSTGFDVSTASFTQNFSVSAQDVFPAGIAFNTDGTKMYVVGTENDNVNEYALSTGFDISTASFSQDFSLSGQDLAPVSIRFNNDGTKMFILGAAGQDVNEYDLSTAFDVSTASFTILFSVAAQETEPRGLAFSTDGTKMFITGSNGDDINQYSTTPASTTVLAGKSLSSTSINLDYTT